jgi:hypothetical protein
MGEHRVGLFKADAGAWLPAFTPAQGGSLSCRSAVQNILPVLRCAMPVEAMRRIDKEKVLFAYRPRWMTPVAPSLLI